MLDRRDLDRYGPPGFHSAQKEKDYVQHWVLTFLSRSGFGGVLKGGTCLQKAFGLPRYSEDLDFELNGAREPDLEAISAFLASAGFTGLAWRREAKDVSTSARLRYRGPLYAGSPLSEGTVRLELSGREKTVRPPLAAAVNPPYPDLLPYHIRAMGLEEAAAEKVRALMTRRSARDLFDLYFLLRRGTRLDLALVEAKLGYYELGFDLGRFERRVEGLRGVWRREMDALTPSELEHGEVAGDVVAEARRQLAREGGARAASRDGSG